MLIPKFEVNQDEQYVILKIHAPYTKVSEAEITILESELTFFAKPYLLKLAFPADVEEDGSSCSYDADVGSYIANVRKVKQGEVFENLDLLTTLLCSKKASNSTKPLIEVVSHKVELPDAEKTFSISWTTDEDLGDSYGFGFSNQLHEMPVMESLLELLMVEDPSKISASDRRMLRIESEEEKFDSDYYLADLYEDEVVSEVLKFRPWWKNNCDVIFSDEERETMQRLPNKEYLQDEMETKLVFMGLVDILFGHVYNIRVTEGENNVESSWMIRTLSSTLSCCDTSLNITDQLITSYRRVLCYPQYRSWKLAQQLQKDVVSVLKGGKRCVLKCLLQILNIFRTADTAPCYLLNDLYINDYCVWIQKVPHGDVTLTSLASAIENIEISKSDVGFELVLLEEAAKLVLEEHASESNPDPLVEGLSSLNL